MNVELEHLEQLDKFSSIVKRLAGALTPQEEITREFRLILIEADQMRAVDHISDVLVHLAAAREILSKISFE